MKSKTLLHVAMVLDIVYAVAMIGILSSQNWIYALVTSDLQGQIVFPIYNIVEMVVSFAIIMVLIFLLKENQEQVDNKKELLTIVVLTIALVIGPLISIFGNSLTSQMYGALVGVESVAAYGVLGSYMNFANIFGKAAMVFLLIYAALSYGNKIDSDN